MEADREVKAACHKCAKAPRGPLWTQSPQLSNLQIFFGVNPIAFCCVPFQDVLFTANISLGQKDVQ